MEQMEIEVADDEEESTPSLLEFLPPGVLLEIFKFLEWNDLCQISRTCTKFREICQSATLWLQLRRLDFRNCAIPDGEKILKVLKLTQNADTLILGNIISEESNQEPVIDEEEEENIVVEENIVGADKFVLEVLRTCHHIKNLSLHMHEISDRTVEAITAKCTSLVEFYLYDSQHIQNQSILDLVSASTTLNSLHIEQCTEVSFLSLKHTDATKHLLLTRVSLIGLELLLQHVQDLVSGCPCLTHLDLSMSQHLQSFTGAISQGVRSAMDALKELVLQNCEDLEGIFLPYCPRLISLDVCNCRRLTEIIGTLPSLQTLKTSGCHMMRKIELRSSDLEGLSCLEMVDLETLQLGSDNLVSLDVSKCSRLDADQLVSCVTKKDKLSDLNIEGCKSIPPVDLDEKILPTFTGLQSLVYGGHSWSSVRLKSNTLKSLQFGSCTNTIALPLNMQALKELKLFKCRDFNEQDVIDGLLYGKLIPQKIQSVQILKDESITTPPFSNNTGTPSLCVLKLHDLPGLHGYVISYWLKCLSHLTVLELVRCNFVTHLEIVEWPSLLHLKLESCTRLNRLRVTKIQTLETLDVRWCSMVQDMDVSGKNIKTLDLTGTNFGHLSINCDRLTTLNLNGVCTQPQHTLCLRCCDLRELSIVKCDRLTDNIVRDILQQCPLLESLSLVGSLSLGSLHLPGTMQNCSLTGHRILREIDICRVSQIRHLTLNNLPKFTPTDRLKLLKNCEETLEILEVRAIRGETELILSLKHLTSLTLDQGIQLATLSINCLRLQNLRIQGCPKLQKLTIHLDKLSQLQVYHSSPLLALRCLTLDCKRVPHLPRVLSYYCPKLEELTIKNCTIEFLQLYQLGEALPHLHTVNTESCLVKNRSSEESIHVIQSASLGRREAKDLVVTLDR